MELVLSKQELYHSFFTDWTQKWIPAVINYSKTLKRKDIKNIVKNLSECKYIHNYNCLCSCMLFSFS